MVIAFHKPYGVLSQFTPDCPGQHTLAAFGFPTAVYPVGRLDLDSEGLLLLTDEPGFNHRLLDPRCAHPRTYRVQVEGSPNAAAIEQLARGGLAIQNYRTLPCRACLLDPEPELPPRDPPIRFRKAIPTSWLELELTEGKNRQVRRMTAAVGFPTLRLVRWAIGGLTLDDLAPGIWKILPPDELRRIWQRQAVSQPNRPAGSPSSSGASHKHRPAKNQSFRPPPPS
jgi:23S rRNA pseudouridine2457 synthase